MLKTRYVSIDDGVDDYVVDYGSSSQVHNLSYSNHQYTIASIFFNKKNNINRHTKRLKKNNKYPLSIVPRSFNQNIEAPWELIVMKLFQKINSSNRTNQENFLDEFLDSFDKNSLDERRSSDRRSLDERLLDGRSLDRRSLDERLLDGKSSDISENKAGRFITCPGKLFNNNFDCKKIGHRDDQKIYKKIYSLIASVIFDKSLKLINRYIMETNILEPGTFWCSIESPYIGSTDTIQSTRSPKSQKMKMIDYVENVLYQHDNSVMLMCLFNFRTIPDPDAPHYHYQDYTNDIYPNMMCPRTNDSETSSFDDIGIKHIIQSHPFILYCIVENEKLQMYKLIITDLDYPKKIGYDMYQIDNDSSTPRLLISRDITNKFIQYSTDPRSTDPRSTDPRSTDPRSTDRSNNFEINLEHSNITVNIFESQWRRCLYAEPIINAIIQYISYWSLLTKFIIEDATRCVRAFIKNPKKVKISIDPSTVDHSVIRSLLQEKIIEKIDVKDNYLDSILQITAIRQYVKFPETTIHKRFHPLSILTELLQIKPLIDKKEYNRLNTNCNIFDNITSEVLLKKYIVAEHIKKSQYMRDIVFFDDYFVLDTFNKNIFKSILLDATNDKMKKPYISMNEQNKNNKPNRIICNFSIKSSIPLNIYIKVNDSCQLIGHGTLIRFPIVYEYIVQNMFIKFDKTPEEILEIVKLSNVPPFIQMEGTFLTEYNQNYPNSYMIEVVSQSQDNQEIVVSIALIEHEFDNNIYIYFGQIRDIDHLLSIESKLSLNF